VLIGNVGLGKTHLSIALGHTACLNGHSVLFTTAVDIIKSAMRSRTDVRQPLSIVGSRPNSTRASACRSKAVDQATIMSELVGDHRFAEL